ncbi:ceramidase domain-containing protein [Pararhodobacter zhoushanensis]|uniref:ceramidase domain-containing protein n=1 Tax=Pararhodobacter zhoushanensis TaxID=2479545 RepID=UPI000F8D84E3|nr:ceramidase domain-containing protein [Pararhodobacter zhoushanensis]
MAWTDPVDIYCERVSAAFWAEPVNALTNAAFVLAALWGAAEARKRGVRSPMVWVLIVMAGVIGVGSFLFHTFATRWSELADTLPIWSFVAAFVLAAMHFIGGMPVKRVLRVAVIIVVAAVGAIWLAGGEGADVATAAPDPLNGSGQYAPAVLALAVFTGIAFWRKHPGAPWILAAFITFLISLSLRTLDRDICTSFPLGTHFAWHTLNGLMIGLLLQMLIRTGHFGKIPSDSAR